MKKILPIIICIVLASSCNINPSKEARIQKLETEMKQTLERINQLESEKDQLKARLLELEMKN